MDDAQDEREAGAEGARVGEVGVLGRVAGHELGAYALAQHVRVGELCGFYADAVADPVGPPVEDLLVRDRGCLEELNKQG